MTRRDIQDNASGGPALQNAASRSHTSELTRGCFCFQVSTGGLRWVSQMSRASSGWPGAGKTKGSRGLSLSLHISDFRHKNPCGIRKLTAAFVSKIGVFSRFSWSLDFGAKMAEFPLPVLQIWRSRKRVAIQIQLMNIHVSECKYYCLHLVPKFGDMCDRQNWRLHPTGNVGLQTLETVAAANFDNPDGVGGGGGGDWEKIWLGNALGCKNRFSQSYPWLWRPRAKIIALATENGPKSNPSQFSAVNLPQRGFPY